ncbi:YdcF family protein [Corynebacterium felinum]|uniref:Uncharacterized SAM-binding protein YcdF (DUF218 family) n=1 Tax=Corynebacterium felinum TaxID=131318 RepID=A0ABU2BCH3_9CORY|nr:YdcF family protein [Corynebacterium felinum]MDF5821185.1 YdcF family protein [Corynebacterium felinum]MDR7356298.1 uncharacterized SAM-binding protein YcdF (DUF218 family) [Corynebacterium felinum]WJY95632.1 hypothetical protein CFELI_10170 [Corynebacterium felinum]
MNAFPAHTRHNLLPTRTRRRHTHGGKVALSLAVLALCPAALVLVRGRIRPKNRRGRFNTILVFGTAQYNGVPSRQFAGRLRWAQQLWQMHEYQTVVTVGGKLDGDAYTEAAVGRTFLVQNGVDPDCLIMVEEGNDTRSSLEAAREHLTGRVLIVTDPQHSVRAELCARLLGIDAVSSPTPHNRVTMFSVMHELGGLMVLGIEFVAGFRAARAVEDACRRLQGVLRPSRKARHEQMRKMTA